MEKAMKKLIFLIFSVLLVSGEAFAQNKVVVIPLGSASANEDIIMVGGLVSLNGTASSSFGKPFTVTHSETGVYNIHIAGLRPGCEELSPIVMVSCWGVGFCSPQGMVASCGSGDVDVYVSTSNPSGTPDDMTFTLLVMTPSAPQTSASPSAAAKSFAVCELNTATGVETCR